MWSSVDILGTSPGFGGVYEKCGSSTGENRGDRAANLRRMVRILSNSSNTGEWDSEAGATPLQGRTGSSTGERRRNSGAHVGRAV